MFCSPSLSLCCKGFVFGGSMPTHSTVIRQQASFAPILQFTPTPVYNRLQRVSQNCCTSDRFRLPYGVPQGSCLGRLLFTITYSSKLFEIIKYYLPEALGYVDDTQLYLSFSHD